MSRHVTCCVLNGDWTKETFFSSHKTPIIEPSSELPPVAVTGIPSLRLFIHVFVEAARVCDDVTAAGILLQLCAGAVINNARPGWSATSVVVSVSLSVCAFRQLVINVCCVANK